MAQTIHYFMLCQAAGFIVGALVHFGVLTQGYEHLQAGIAESVIAAVLVLGLLWMWLHPASTRTVGLAVQAFALLGTCIGVVTMVIGVGPRTEPDMVYHAVLLLLLVWGLLESWWAPNVARRAHG